MKRLVLALAVVCVGHKASASCEDIWDLGGPEGRFVEVADLTFLMLLTVHRNENDTYRIAKFNDLPRGGIDGAHLCGFAYIKHFGSSVPKPAKVDAVISANVLLLHSGVDYRMSYPGAFPIIQRRNQMVYFPSQRVWVQRLEEGLEITQKNEIVDALIARHSRCANNMIVEADETVIIPTC